MFKIFDGIFWSQPAYVTVTIEAINDNPPELSVTPRGDRFIENGGAIDLLGDVVLTDADHNEQFNITALHVCASQV